MIKAAMEVLCVGRLGNAAVLAQARQRGDSRTSEESESKSPCRYELDGFKKHFLAGSRKCGEWLEKRTLRT